MESCTGHTAMPLLEETTVRLGWCLITKLTVVVVMYIAATGES